MPRDRESIPVDPHQVSAPQAVESRFVRPAGGQPPSSAVHEIRGGTPLLLELTTRLCCAMMQSSNTVGPEQVDGCFTIAGLLIDGYNARLIKGRKA